MRTHTAYEKNKKKIKTLGNRITTNTHESRGGISTDGPTAVLVTQVNEPCALPAYAAPLREPSSCGPNENRRHTCGEHDSVRQHGARPVSYLGGGKVEYIARGGKTETRLGDGAVVDFVMYIIYHGGNTKKK